MPLSENWKLLPLAAKLQLLDRLRELPDGTPGDRIQAEIDDVITGELERMAERS